MSTGNEPNSQTGPAPAYNPDPAVTGYTPSALTPGPGPDDGMLVIAAFRKSGSDPWPGMDWFAQKIGALLNGEAGLWIVYATTPPAAPTPLPIQLPATPPYNVKRAPGVAQVHYYHLPTDAAPYMAVATSWTMTVLERTGPPSDFLKVLAKPEIWVPAGEVVAA